MKEGLVPSSERAVLFVAVVGVCESGNFKARMQCELFENVVHVALHSVGGKMESLSYILIAQALRY